VLFLIKENETYVEISVSRLPPQNSQYRPHFSCCFYPSDI
ncbi:MAG: hypothetical protein ACI9IJ_002458, partial [Psychromonas sp.]